MKKYLCLMVLILTCVIQLFSASVVAVTTTTKEVSSSTSVLPNAAVDIKTPKKNQIKKLITVFMEWKNDLLITKDGQFKLGKTTKLYDFVDSKHKSAREAGKAITELIFVDDKLKIVIIRPKEERKP